MIPVFQTILHDPENDLHGNCLSATLASLLHLPIEDIPIFKDDNTWIPQLNEWLRPHGLAYICIQAAYHILEEQGIKGLYHEVGIQSPRFEGVQHSCVALDSSIVHDPHRGSDSSKAIPNTMGLFIALQPWKSRTSTEHAGLSQTNSGSNPL